MVYTGDSEMKQTPPKIKIQGSDSLLPFIYQLRKNPLKSTGKISTSQTHVVHWKFCQDPQRKGKSNNPMQIRANVSPVIWPDWKLDHVLSCYKCHGFALAFFPWRNTDLAVWWNEPSRLNFRSNLDFTVKKMMFAWPEQLYSF